MYRTVAIALLVELTMCRLPAGAPVEGDVAALQLLRDVQAANATAFPGGRVRFKAAWHLPLNATAGLGVEERFTWTGTVLWDQGQSFWDLHSEYDVLRAGVWVPREVAKSTREVITPKYHFMLTYRYSDPKLPLTALREYRDDPLDWAEFEVLPKQVWYKLQAPSKGDKTSWSDLFNPEFNPKHTVKLVVQRPDADRIVVQRHYQSGVVNTISCSLAAGGNVVRSESPFWPDAPRGWSKMGKVLECEWSPVGDGRFWLRRLERTNTNPESKLTRIYLLELSDFDPNPKIAAGQFTFEALGVPQGTTVYEIRNGGPRTMSVHGNRPAQPSGVSAADLERLAEEVRRSGFAKPDR